MSIYNIEQLTAKVKVSERDELRIMLTRILTLSLSENLKSSLARIILNDSVGEVKGKFCQLTDRRIISYAQMKSLQVSPLLDWTREIIHLALEAPRQSGEILLRLAPIAGTKALDIKQHDLTLAGYILSMAGFERKSHHDRERTHPIKAWKLTENKHLSINERVTSVLSHIKFEVARVEEMTEPQPLAKPDVFEDFI